MKIEIPITAISDKLFDSKVIKQPVESTPDGIAQDEIDKINEDAREEYKLNHPTVKEFIEGK